MKPNPQQIEVINHGRGPCLVTAVPGSGKTTVLTARVNKLVSSGVKPFQILAITFTNKAANEMKARISKVVGEKVAKEMVISTFHSFCARLLRKHHDAAGLRQNFTIFDADDQKRLLESCICKVLDLDKKRDIDREDYYAILGYIERTRNACLSDGNRDMMPAAWMYRVVDQYYASLEQSNAVDFTGLLDKSINLLESNPVILERYQDRFQFISVDEVQDTNVAQYKIVSMLARKHKNILMVGDVDQSIYKFRNASPENILQFEKDFGAKVLKLESNYRSTPEILDVAHRLIKRNKFRKDTSLETSNARGDEPRITCGKTDDIMAENIVRFVDRRLRRGTPPSEVAILYRIKSATRVLEQALRKARIKYKIIGGRSFYERKEVKGCLSILRMMVNDDDRMAFENASELCCRGVGPKSLDKIFQHSLANRSSIIEAARVFGRGSSKQATVMRQFVSVLDAAKSVAPHQGLMDVAKKTSFWRTMGADKSVESDRCGNIMEMCRDVEKYMSEENKTLDRYLQDISLLSANDEEEDVAKINLMTIHACKGLEFDAVVVSHVNDGILPHQNCLEIEDQRQRAMEIEEERRLLYVAMTRARRWLLLGWCETRFGKKCDPSRFLMETGISSLD